MRRTMTKIEALREFADIWRQVVQHNPRAANDRPMKREMFGIWTDTLCKDGRISPHQFRTWSNPF